MNSSVLCRLRRHESGSTTILFGLAALTLVGAVGGAIDYNRYAAARRATQAAVDAAVLAGARTLLMNPDDSTAAINAATNYYNGNVAGRVQLASDTISFKVVENKTAVTAEGGAKLATTFLQVLGIPQLTVMSQAAAGFPKAKISGGGGSDIEVAVMLDLTGSMCDDGVGPCTSGTKLTAMKDAAKELVDIVVRDEQTPKTSKVALVPFSTRIRVAQNGAGGNLMTQLTGMPDTWSGWRMICTQSNGGSGGSEGNGDWECLNEESQYQTDWKIMPCVTDRYYNSSSSYDYTDDKPGSGEWLNAHGGDRSPESWDSSETAQTSYTGATQADPSYNWNYDPTGYCHDVSEDNLIVPLTSDKTSLKSAIDNLEAYGSTSGTLGTAFAWYMLSPKWTSIWTGPSAPGGYNLLTTQGSNGAPQLRKVAVLMSDGVYNTVRGWKEQDQQEMSNHAKQLCTNMKAAGIEIYTIGFALDQLTPSEKTIAEDTLLSCGSSVEHFYNTLTANELTAAFQDIGIKLTSIALSK